MEMEMEVVNEAAEMSVLTGRLAAAAEALEQAADRLAGVNTLDMQAAHSREHELETRLAAAEATIASYDLSRAGGRKTIAGGAAMVAKDGIAVEAGALDAALTSLSVEQRIAVKAGLMRSGLLG